MQDITKISASDGFSIGATIYEPSAPARGTLIIHGGTAIQQGYYGAFAAYAASRARLRAITYDYRGVGHSRPESLESLVDFDANMTDWARLDARAVIEYAKERYGDPLVMVGHSFGGQMIGLIDEWRDVKAAILVAAQFGWYGHWSGFEKWLMAARWMLVPAVVGAFGYLPGRAGLGVDIPKGVASEWAAWCRHPHYLGGHHADANERFARFDVPTLLFSFTDDDYAPAPSVNALKKRLKSAPLVHRRVDPAEVGAERVGHFGFFKSAHENDLWAEALGFCEDALAGRTGQLALPAPFLTSDEVMADLQYGR